MIINFCFSGNGGGGEGAGVSSINGKSGAVSLASINGKDLTTETEITIEGGSGDLLKSRSEFPETAEYGDVISKAEGFPVSIGRWDEYPKGVVNVNNGMSYDTLWDKDGLLLELEWFKAYPKLMYTANGTVIFTDSSNEILEEVHQGESKSHQYFGITDTTREYTLTVDWTRAEENILLVSGPDDASHKIAINQTFQDPTGTDYHYGLYEYVHQGEWAKVIANSMVDNKRLFEIEYEYIPDTELPLDVAELTSNNVGYFVYFTPEHQLVYRNTGSLDDITPIYKNTEATIGSGIHRVFVLWENNIIRFRTDYSYPTIRPMDYVITDYWRKISDDTKADAADVTADSGIPRWNNQGIIVGQRYPLQEYSFQINNSSYSSYMYYFGQRASAVSRIYAPTAAGVSGQVLVSGGDNVAPSWATMIKSVRITEDEYEALAVKDNNTLYLIVEE